MAGLVDHVQHVILTCMCFTFVFSSASSLCERQIDLGFVMDSSASVGEKNFMHIKKFVKDVVKQFAIGPEKTQIGMIPFSHYFKVEIKLNQFTDYGQLVQAVDNLPYEGSGSTLAGALKVAQLELFTPENGGRKETIDPSAGTAASEGEEEGKEVLQALVVISDGGSSTGVDALLNAAETLKRSGKRVFVVGLGKHDNMKNIKMMASETEEKHIFLVNKGEELGTVVKKLAKAICNDVRPSMQKFIVTENDKVITSLLYKKKSE